MSILIKGMDMPKDTERVEIIFWHSIGEKDEYILQHNMDVKAVEIPTPHGRLIDGDAVICNIKEIAEMHDNVLTDFEALALVRNAPTILEAEE